MPIHPDNKARYPKDWPAISLRIRFVRAGGRCECEGECGHDHGGRCEAIHGEPHPVTASKVVLTTAHLNHTPEDCRDEVLRYALTLSPRLEGVRLSKRGHWGNLPYADEEAARASARADAGKAPFTVEPSTLSR